MKTQTFFSKLETEKHPLFILEMANNHMGDIDHGIRIIQDFYKVTKQFPFHFAFKFQARDIDTFIHPDYKMKIEHTYSQRFLKTKLSYTKMLLLKKEAEKLGFIPICTPFDEKSVDLIKKIDFDIIKIGSCSFNDWPLLEKIVTIDKPIIASTGGALLEDIDKVVNFFQNRNKTFALMHCIGEYPTKEDHLELNQIDFLKERYDNVIVGFSTHEEPDNYFPVQLAVAKGAKIFERHVGVKTEIYSLNKYSSTPEQVYKWLEAAQRALSIGGVRGKRSVPSDKEIADLRQFKRGVFAKKLIKKGELITSNKVYFAFPNCHGQLVANDLSKYISLIAQENIGKDKPVINVKKIDERKKVYTIVKNISVLISKSNVAVPQKVDLEISHHYGIDLFSKYGMAIITCVNLEYCKKLLILLPNQKNPTHFHKKKDESFHVLYGELMIDLEGRTTKLSKGDVITVKPNVKHSFWTKTGGIFEEISSTHYVKDSYYEDKKIQNSNKRKTFVTYWRIDNQSKDNK